MSRATAVANPGNRTYPCRSGQITVSVENAEQWHAFAVSIGRPELAYVGSWEVVCAAAAEGPTAAVVAEMLAEDEAGWWVRRFEENGVPAKVIA